MSDTSPIASINPDDVSRVVMLTYGRMEDGKNTYWCYVAVIPSQHDQFLATLKAGKLNLHTFSEDGFGEVLVSGPGLYPPVDVTKRVAELFNTPLTELFPGAKDASSLIAQKIDQLKKMTENNAS